MKLTADTYLMKYLWHGLFMSKRSKVKVTRAIRSFYCVRSLVPCLFDRIMSYLAEIWPMKCQCVKPNFRVKQSKVNLRYHRSFDHTGFLQSLQCPLCGSVPIWLIQFICAFFIITKAPNTKLFTTPKLYGINTTIITLGTPDTRRSGYVIKMVADVVAPNMFQDISNKYAESTTTTLSHESSCIIIILQPWNKQCSRGVGRSATRLVSLFVPICVVIWPH